MKSIVLLICAISLSIALVQTHFHHPLKSRGKRHMLSGMQDDSPVHNQEHIHKVSKEGPVRPLSQHRGTFNYEPSAIGKRSVESLDSFPNLSHYLMNSDLSDVHLVVNNSHIPAHKLVLAAKSHKFSQLFRSDPNKTVFDMGRVSEDVLKVMLTYFYTETFQWNDEKDLNKTFKVFHLADEYEVHGLKAQVERSLAKHIQTDNYIDIFKWAEVNRMEELIKLWKTFLFTNTMQIMSEDKFSNESTAVVMTVLSALNVPTSYVLTKVKELKEQDRDVPDQDIRAVVHLERCNFDDLATLGEMGLYGYKFLFEDVIKRYHALSVNCQRPVRLNPSPRWLTNTDML